MPEISPAQDHRSAELWHLRVAVYCRVITETEEQTNSIELQRRYHRCDIVPGIELVINSDEVAVVRSIFERYFSDDSNY